MKMTKNIKSITTEYVDKNKDKEKDEEKRSLLKKQMRLRSLMIIKGRKVQKRRNNQT